VREPLSDFLLDVDPVSGGISRKCSFQNKRKLDVCHEQDENN